MSFSITGKTGLKVTGLNEAIAALAAGQREQPQVNMNIHRDMATFFVSRAKEHVHVITGNLGRSIKVESITPERAVVHATMPYASAEEGREGRRRTAPNTEHAYMKPAAEETALQMPRLIKRRYDELWARHKTR